MAKVASSFSGFPKAALTFFKQLAKNNTVESGREWFTPRKAEYEASCKRPMELLVEAINARLAKSAVEYVTPDVKRAVYRIYRDTRFAKDKTPYKTHVAAYLQRKGYAKNAGPGFYVQVSDKGVGVAGGIYMVGPEELRAVRQAIVEDVEGWEKVATGKKLMALMGKVQGDALTRVPKGFEGVGGTAAEPWVRMKQWYFWAELEPKWALSPQLPKVLTDRIEAMVPACEWLHAALARVAGKDEENKPKRPTPMF